MNSAYPDQIISTTATEVTNEVKLPKHQKVKNVKFEEGAVTTSEYSKQLRAGLGLAIGENSFLNKVTKS